MSVCSDSVTSTRKEANMKKTQELQQELESMKAFNNCLRAYLLNLQEYRRNMKEFSTNVKELSIVNQRWIETINMIK